ncbi:MAG: copper resistance protein CopC [Acidocella sp.]|uniref:copper resistance CopC family protein n=1 Tax=Acidocella sp. TaxID=50710 RepID=UPI003FBF40BB
MKRLLPLLAVLAPVPAFAHAFLKHAEPGVGAVVATPPAQLLLTYTEGLEVPFCTVTVEGPDGTQVQTGKPQPVPGHEDEMSVPVHIAAPGKYTVTWRALSVDTHKTQGSFSFTIAP